MHFTELPPVPVIYINGARQVASVAGPYDENTNLSLICEVAGGIIITHLSNRKRKPRYSNRKCICLSVKLAGGPDMAVSWYRNGRLVESRVEHRMHDYFYHLHLKSVSRAEHQTTFSCQLELDVQPPVPPVSCSVTLNIRSKYKFDGSIFSNFSCTCTLRDAFCII